MRMRSRRNRKRKTHRVAYMSVSFAGVVVLVVTLSVIYVWLSLRCEFLGNEIKALETRKQELTRRHQEELFKWTQMKTPRHMIKTLAERGIAMNWPAPHQMRRMNRRDLYADLWDDTTASRQVASVRRSGVHE